MHHCSFMNGNEMWIFGGRTSDLDPLGDTYKLNLARKVWDKVLVSNSDGPEPRWGASLCPGPKKSMILFGGCTTSSIFSDTWTFCLGLSCLFSFHLAKQHDLPPIPL